MAETFDPYYRWLGIPAKEQPPNHYRLLGIELFESDPQLIDSFALRHTSFLREITDGPHLQEAQRLLNELAAARRCLLDPQQKAAYDAELRERLAAANEVVPPPAPEELPPPPVMPRPVVSADDASAIAGAVGNESEPLRSNAAVRPQRHARRAGWSRFLPTKGGTINRRARRAHPTDQGSNDPRSAPAGHITLAAGTKTRQAKPAVWVWTGLAAVALAAFGIIVGVSTRSDRNCPARTDAAATKTAKSPAAARSRAAEPKALAKLKPTPTTDATADDATADGSGGPADGKPAAPAAEGAAPELPMPAAAYIPQGQPPRLAGMILWLDASQLTAADGRIGRWSDAGGGNFVAQGKQESGRPEVLDQALQGKAVARFRGGQWLEISGTSQKLNLGSDYTIVYVARGVGGTLLSKGSGGKDGQFSLLSDSCFLTNGESNAASGGRLAATGDDPAQFRIRTITADATALRWFVDGTASGTYSDDRHAIQNTTVLRIGSPQFRSGQEDATPFFVGDLAELLIYNRALADDERQGVEQYLREKWLSGAEAPAPLDLVAAPVESPPAAKVATTDPPDTSMAATVAEPAAGEQLAETGSIRREVWRNFRGIDLAAVHELWTARPEPDLSETADRFEAPADFDDNYCQRFRGFLQPPITGDYTFSVRANEEGVLFVSTDEKPENQRPVTAKDKIALTAGRAYYVEAVHWEKGGKDSFSVGWKLPDGNEEHPIPGSRLSLRDRPIPPHETGFAALTPVRAEASAGSQLQILNDGSVLADGVTKENEVYRLAFELPMPTLTAFQLQAVAHESLPGGGPGLGAGGSFRLGEVQAEAGAVDAGAAPQTAKFREVLSSDDDSGLARLIDGNPATVWGCRRGGQPVSLTLLLAEPLRSSGTAMLNVTLHNRENLGCFRLLATSMPEPRKRTLASGPQQPSPSSDLFTLFVNLGGGPWQDPAGNSWVASKDYDGATFGHEGGQAIKSDAAEHPMYGTAVRKLTAFRAVVPNGQYAVELHFHEHWSRNPADRSFAVAIEQQPVLRPPMFFQGPGMGQPYVHSIGRVTVKDGRLDVDFSPALPGSLTILNGIAIRQIR